MRRLGDETEGFGVEEIAQNFVDEDVDGVAEEDEGFLDPRSEVASALDAADSNLIQIESRSFVSAQGEFFDAIDGNNLVIFSESYVRVQILDYVTVLYFNCLILLAVGR